jgi:hypothetical protein
MTERQIVGTFLLGGSVLLFLVLPLLDLVLPGRRVVLSQDVLGFFCPLFLAMVTGFFFLVLPPYKRRE